MTNRTDMVSPDALVLTHALEKLRARDGLTYSRLENSRSVEAAPLLSLAAVRRHAAVHDIELAQAALDVTAECVRESLSGSQRPVADAILGLGVFSEAYTRHGVEARVVAALHSNLLGRRRNTLLSSWRSLHKALGLTPSDPPSDRAWWLIDECAEPTPRVSRRSSDLPLSTSVSRKGTSTSERSAHLLEKSTERCCHKAVKPLCWRFAGRNGL